MKSNTPKIDNYWEDGYNPNELDAIMLNSFRFETNGFEVDMSKIKSFISTLLKQRSKKDIEEIERNMIAPWSTVNDYTISKDKWEKLKKQLI